MVKKTSARPSHQEASSSDAKLAEIRRLLVERERIDSAIKAVLEDGGQRKKGALSPNAFRSLCGV